MTHLWSQRGSHDQETPFLSKACGITCTEMLYLIGLGLGDAKDITVKGLEIVKSAKQVFLESYTSILTVGKEALVSVYVKHGTK